MSRVEEQCVECRYVTRTFVVSLYCVIVLLSHVLKHELLCLCSQSTNDRFIVCVTLDFSVFLCLSRSQRR